MSKTDIEKLHNAFDAENIIASCCGRLSEMIKNGRIRNQFILFSETAKNNKLLLKERLNFAEDQAPGIREKCEFCRIKPESFSLSGALNLGLEITGTVIKYYRELLGESSSDEDKELFRSLIKEKNSQRDFFKKEKRFLHGDEDKLSMIDSHCIREVIAELWK